MFTHYFLYLYKLYINIIKCLASKILPAVVEKKISSGICVLHAWNTHVPIRSHFQVEFDYLRLLSLPSPLEESIRIITGFRTLFGRSRETPWKHSCSNLLQPPRTLGRSQREASDWSETGREAGRARFAMDRIANRIANNERVLLRQIRAGVIWQEPGSFAHSLLRKKLSGTAR